MDKEANTGTLRQLSDSPAAMEACWTTEMRFPLLLKMWDLIVSIKMC